MAIVSVESAETGYVDKAPRIERRLHIDGLLGSSPGDTTDNPTPTDVGSQLKTLEGKFPLGKRMVDETHNIRYHGETRRAHLSGWRLALGVSNPLSDRQERWGLTAVKLNVDADGEALANDYLVVFLPPAAATYLYHEERMGLRTALHQGIAVKLETGGDPPGLSIHPYRDLNGTRPWEGPDYVVSESVELPSSPRVLSKLDGLIQHAEPLVADTQAA